MRILRRVKYQARRRPSKVQVCPPARKFLKKMFSFSTFSSRTLALTTVTYFTDRAIRVAKVKRVHCRRYSHFTTVLAGLGTVKVTYRRLSRGHVIVRPKGPRKYGVGAFRSRQITVTFTVPKLIASNVIVRGPSYYEGAFRGCFRVLSALYGWGCELQGLSKTYVFCKGAVCILSFIGRVTVINGRAFNANRDLFIEGHRLGGAFFGFPIVCGACIFSTSVMLYRRPNGDDGATNFVSRVRGAFVVCHEKFSA